MTEATATAQRSTDDLAIARREHNLAVAPHTKGLQARSTLAKKIRTRLGEILRDDLLMPIWFDRVLGPTAPANNTQEWLDTAVEVVLYRLMHHIEDPVLALGQRPDDTGGAQEYDRLLRRCARSRQSR